MFKNTDKWITSYSKRELSRLFSKREMIGPVHVLFCFVDHYEPDYNGADPGLQMERVQRWIEGYPQVADKHKDIDGMLPKHTFFCPAESYVKEHFDLLAGLCTQGYGEVEIHLHHDNDTEETLREKLLKAKADFASHGFLGKDKTTGEIKYGFIHGNWSLNNSRSDGKWCGVNDEARILRETGCYADFTFPSAPSETQPKKINSIYYAGSSKEKPKGHDTGEDVKVGGAQNEGLMLVQGPLALNWKNRKKGVFPRIENADITGTNQPTDERVALWIDQQICVKGRPEWIFVKVHTHGAPEKNAWVILGDPVDRMFSVLEERYNDGKNFILHYVTAREMYNIVKAAEAGESGDPNLYRDYEILL